MKTVHIHDTEESKQRYLAQRRKQTNNEETHKLFATALEEFTSSEAEEKEILLPPEIMKAKLEKEKEERLRTLQEQAEKAGILLPTYLNRNITSPGKTVLDNEVLLPCGY
jgi:hypothetical protein